MKKLLILLFSILISFNSYGLFHETVCDETDTQYRNQLYYLPNETKPFTGNNLCEYENGQIKHEGNYKDGKEDGKWTYWNENDQKYYEENYKDGDLVDNTLFKYYDNGQIEESKNYKDKGLNVKSTFWYKNGQKFAEGNYKDSKLDGTWTWWNMKGQKIEEGNYKDGDLVDKTLFKYSYFTGHLKSKKKYKDGKCISGDCPD